MVSFQQSILWFFQRWRNIKGRSTRAEFWWVMLVWIPYIFFDEHILTPLLFGLSIFLHLVIIVPLSTLIVRRCIDVGIPQWLGLLISFTPIFLDGMISLNDFLGIFAPITFDDSMSIVNSYGDMGVLLAVIVVLSLFIFVIALIPSKK